MRLLFLSLISFSLFGQVFPNGQSQAVCNNGNCTFPGTLSVGTTIPPGLPAGSLITGAAVVSNLAMTAHGPMLATPSVASNLVASDTFTDADNTAIASHVMTLGQGWTLSSGAGQILSNQLVATSSSVTATTEAGISDLTISANIVASTASGNAHMQIRYQDTSNYVSCYLQSTGYVYLRKFVAGVATIFSGELLSPAMVNGQSYSMSLSAFGPWLSCSINGRVYATAYDTAFQTLTKVGFYTTSTTWAIDNLAVSPIAELPVVPAYPSSVTATNATSPLVTPSYDGNRQCMHPSVVYVAVGWGWNASKYWMACTMFTGGSSALENPQIFASADGTTWVVPTGFTNPLAPKPAWTLGYNSDTELRLGPDNVLYAFYREIGTGNVEIIRYKTTSDGVTWSGAKTLLSGLQLTSPTILWDGQWRMWSVDLTITGGNAIVYRTASTLSGLATAQPIWCSFDKLIVGAVPNLWHLYVTRDGNKYVSIPMTIGTGNNYALNYAVSYDGIYWATSATPFLQKTSAGHWDDTELYRSSILPIAGGNYDLFYSAENSSSVWHIGRTTINVAP